MKYIVLTHFSLDDWIGYLYFKKRAFQSELLSATVVCSYECYFLENIEFVLITNNFVFTLSSHMVTAWLIMTAI